MKRVYCEREMEIIKALRTGALDVELENHAAKCAICADTLAVSHFLLADSNPGPFQPGPLAPDCYSEAEFLAAEESRLGLYTGTLDQNTRSCTSLPDSDFLWWKGQLASKQLAIERATRSIALVRKISYLSVAAAGLWVVFTPGHLGSFIKALSKYQIGSASSLDQSALFVGIGALAFTLLGSLYLARPEK